MLNHNIRRVLVLDDEDNYLGCIIQEKIIFQFEEDLFKNPFCKILLVDASVNSKE